MKSIKRSRGKNAEVMVIKTKKNDTHFKIIRTNANGISSKIDSLINLIKNDNPSCFVLQETKLKR